MPVNIKLAFTVGAVPPTVMSSSEVNDPPSVTCSAPSPTMLTDCSQLTTLYRPYWPAAANIGKLFQYQSFSSGYDGTDPNKLAM